MTMKNYKTNLPKVVKGEFRFHNFCGTPAVMDEIEQILNHNNWKLNKNAFNFGSEYGNWYEVMDLSDMKKQDICKQILFYANNKYFYDFDYIFICRNPKAILASLQDEIKYSYFTFMLVSPNGKELEELIQTLSY